MSAKNLKTFNLFHFSGAFCKKKKKKDIHIIDAGPGKNNLVVKISPGIKVLHMFTKIELFLKMKLFPN